GIAPYTDEISSALISVLNVCTTSQGTHLSRVANRILPDVLSVLQPKGVEAMRGLWKAYWKTLQRLIKEDPRRELTQDYIESVGKCVEKLGKEGVSVDEMNEIGGMIREQMEDEKRRREQPVGRLENIDLLEGLEYLVGKLFIARGTSFCHYLRPSMPLLFTLIDSSIIKVWGVKLITHLCTFAPDMALYYRPQILQLFIPLFHDEISENRVTASHFLASISKIDRREWKGLAVESLKSLYEMISRPDARTDEYNKATDNGISSICLILKNCGEAIVGREKYNHALKKLLVFLPIRDDGEQVGHVYGFLADLIEAGNQTILGEPNVNSPRLLALLVKALHFDIFSTEHGDYDLKKRLKTIIQEIGETDCFYEWVERAEFNNDEYETLERLIGDNPDDE
ncbi:hypothetical protein PMAYCL1PPCAC_27156, partial [Pristionchus mayeri]